MARDFDGVDDVAGNDTTPVTAYPFTLACWANHDVLGANKAVFGVFDKDAADVYHFLSLHAGTHFKATSQQAGGGARVASSAVSYSADTWIHIAGVFTSDTSRTVYANGASPITNTGSAVVGALDRVYVGALGDSTPSAWFDGRIAEAAIWNVALTAGEIAALAKRVSPRRIRPSSLVFYAPLYGAASPEPDHSGGVRNLTLTGTTAYQHPPVMPPYAGGLWVPTKTGTGQTVAITGLGSAQAFGTVTPVTGNVNVSITGLGSAQAFGAVTPAPGNVNVAITGLASAQAFGTVRTNIAFLIAGLGSAQAFGTPTIVPGGVNVAITGLSTAQAFGTVTALPGNVNVPITGLASAQVFGTVTPNQSGPQTVPITGLGSAQAFGTVTPIPGGVLVSITGLGSAQAFGAVTPQPGNVSVSITGLASAQAFGSVTPLAAITVPITGLGSAQTFGSVTILVGGVVVSITGLGSAQEFGSLVADVGSGPTFNPAIHGGKHRR